MSKIDIGHDLDDILGSKDKVFVLFLRFLMPILSKVPTHIQQACSEQAAGLCPHQD